MKILFSLLLVLCTLFVPTLAAAPQGGAITPHWMPDGESFWYASGGMKDSVILVVRPDGKPATPLLDVELVRSLLEEATGKEVRNSGLPFRKIEFPGDGNTVRFSYKGDQYDLRLGDYTLTAVPAEETKLAKRRKPRMVDTALTVGEPPIMERPSADGSRLLRAEEDNLAVRRAEDDEVVPLTEDGTEYFPWAAEEGCWSPDGRRVAAMRIDNREVPRIAVVDWLRASEEVEYHAYPRAGQRMPLMSVHVLDVKTRARVAIEGTGRPDEYTVVWGWRADGSEVLVGRLDREYKKLELLAADPATGKTRVLVTETSETFIGGLELMQMWRELFREVGDGERFVWMSDKSGWRHLYLYDFSGRELGAITHGEYPVENVMAVNADSNQIWYRGHAEQDPYDTHLYRSKLDGTGFTRLTEGPGTHAISFSPNQSAFVDVFSSPVDPTRTEYRRADGELLRTVAEATVGELKSESWVPPEKFIVPAADGVTELHGLLYKPRDFDPGRKYPILDYIYNGPFVSWVPHTFTDGRSMQAEQLTAKGFLVFIVDGRGTTGRSKAFQDVVYKSFGQNEIPDHAAALRALAADRPFIDLDRVGIFGGSWGGYMTVRAMVTHPDVYHVGVAMAPVYDLYDHHALPIEGYMGTPQNNPEGYETGSSLKLVKNLEGKLLLIHGTSDVNAPFSATMKMAGALTKAGKDHDLIIVPGMDHSMQGDGAGYVLKAQHDYFIEHLMPDLVVPVD